MEYVFSPDFLVLLAGLSFVLGYLIINQLILRALCLTGTTLYVWYYSVVSDEPLWTAIWTSVAMGVANLIGIANLMLRRSRWVIPSEHSDIYPRFPTLPPGDFRDIVKLADRFTVAETTTVTTEHSPVDHLYYILEGGADAKKAGHRFSLPNNIFVGEVAFLTGQNSSATTYLQPNTEVLAWRISDLRVACKKDRFRLALESLISKDLASKVALAIKPEDREAAL